MNEQERELDMMVAELEQENRLMRARNERLNIEVQLLTEALRTQSDRNTVLEEVALQFDMMPVFGDTASSFAAFVRRMKK